MLVRCHSCETCLFLNTDDEGLSEEITQIYTDGRIESSPTFLTGLLAKCPKCSSIIEVPNSGDASLDGFSFRDRLFARTARPAQVKDYYYFVGNGKQKIHSELNLRLEAWQIDNDPYRFLSDKSKPSPNDRPQVWHENVRKVIDLMPNPRRAWSLMDKAECLREIGAFAQAITVLDCETDNNQEDPFWPRAEKIGHFAKLNNPYVQKLCGILF